MPSQSFATITLDCPPQVLPPSLMLRTPEQHGTSFWAALLAAAPSLSHLCVQGLAEQLLTLDTPGSLAVEGSGPVRLSTLGCAILSHVLALPVVRSLLPRQIAFLIPLPALLGYVQSAEPLQPCTHMQTSSPRDLSSPGHRLIHYAKVYALPAGSEHVHGRP